jgi:hypothetical protein
MMSGQIVLAAETYTMCIPCLGPLGGRLHMGQASCREMMYKIFLLECIVQCKLTNVYVLHSGFIGGCLLSSDRLAEGI